MPMNLSEKQFDVVVIGGGAAGMMAAGIAASRGKRVLLLEKNKRLGEKLRITGGGRCNITQYQLDLRKLLAQYGAAEKYLYSAFTDFGVLETEAFFNQQGITLKIEANNRAFPTTEHAPDVQKALERFCNDHGVVIQTESTVKAIHQESAQWKVVVQQKRVQEIITDKVIVATGGLSHPETGSTGDGMKWLRDLGCVLADPTPTLVPIAVSDRWPAAISGVTIPDMKIHFVVDGIKKFTQVGSVLATHFGFSGPLILNSAKKIADLLHEGAVTGTIDLYPKKDLGTLDRELVAVFDINKNKVLKNVLKEFLPSGMTPALIMIISDAHPEALEEKVHSVSKEQRKWLVRLLKGLPFTVKGLMGYDKAIVADGGIMLDEINMRTMELKNYPGMYVVGDLLNINRPSGGFSLQLCWTTGYTAGASV